MAGTSHNEECRDRVENRMTTDPGEADRYEKAETRRLSSGSSVGMAGTICLRGTSTKPIAREAETHSVCEEHDWLDSPKCVDIFCDGTSGRALDPPPLPRFRVWVFGVWAFFLGFRKLAKVGLAKVGQHCKTLKLAKVDGQSRFGHSRVWPKSAMTE